MKFEDLKFKQREAPDIFAVIGMGMGTERAVYEFKNGYALSVLKGSYLCTSDTYEVGVLKDGNLCNKYNDKELFNKLCSIANEDESGQLVFKFVTKNEIEMMAKVLEVIK